MKTWVAFGCAALGTVSWTAAASSIADGSAMSVACQACHGGDGIGVSREIPNLAGQKAAYLAQQLKSFRSGDRKHEIMNPIARQLTDTDIDNLAAFWSSLPAAGSKLEAAEAAVRARKAIMTFPLAFPSGYTIYRTDDSAQDKKVSTYYANAIALQAARAGEPLPDGSIIVVAMSPAKLDAEKKPITDADGRLIADTPSFYSAMEVRGGAGAALPEMLRNGDWTYGLFGANGVRHEGTNYAQCLACHKDVARDSYVFSLKQLTEKARE